MFFLGTNILGSELNTIPLSPTSVDNVTKIELKNGLYDCLYITKEISSDPTMWCPNSWDLDTIFHAEFSDNTSAGNVDWNLTTVSHLIIKRRKIDSFKWMTIYVKEINTLEDFTEGITIIDYYNESSTDYEYALVPVLYGAEGYYNSTFVTSEFSKIFLAEKDKNVGTDITDGFLNTTRVVPSSTTDTILNKYATYLRNTKANYDKGSFKGAFLKLDEETCTFETEDGKRIKLQKSIIDYLADGKPKILKHYDGRIWLMIVTGDINDNAETIYKNRHITFEWTEIGDYQSEEHLYKCNLSDVSDEWWNV